MFRTAVAGEPSEAPPVGVFSVRFTVSTPSTTALGTSGIVTVWLSWLAANVSVPAVAR